MTGLVVVLAMDPRVADLAVVLAPSAAPAAHHLHADGGEAGGPDRLGPGPGVVHGAGVDGRVEHRDRRARVRTVDPDAAVDARVLDHDAFGADVEVAVDGLLVDDRVGLGDGARARVGSELRAVRDAGVGGAREAAAPGVDAVADVPGAIGAAPLGWGRGHVGGGGGARDVWACGGLARVGARADLGAVGDAVAVGVGPAGVGVRPVFAQVREPVVIGIARGRALAGRDLVPLLPLVGKPIVVAIADCPPGGQRYQR